MLMSRTHSTRPKGSEKLKQMHLYGQILYILYMLDLCCDDYELPVSFYCLKLTPAYGNNQCSYGTRRHCSSEALLHFEVYCIGFYFMAEKDHSVLTF